jgi:DNA (cytosine-5)-methyltransferase 1
MAVAVDAFNQTINAETSQTLGSSATDINHTSGVINPAVKMAVRRLTPTECERLQGFPDGYTAIPWRKKPAAECPDGPRYKALGNSMAVPVMRWIGERIALFESLDLPK